MTRLPVPEDCSLAELRQLVPSYITEITAGHWYRRMRRREKNVRMLRSQRKLIVRKWYSPLCGCAGDRVEMVVGVHCGTVLGTNLPPCWKCVPQNSPTMHLTTLATRSPAQPQSGECKPSCLKSLPQTQSCVWINDQDPMEMTVKLSSCYDFRRVRYLWNITGSYIAKRTIALPFELKPKTGTVL